MKIVPRDYQEASHQALWNHLHSKYDRNPLVVMATGTGKSLNMGMLVWHLLAEYPQTRILNVTHVKELVEGNYNALLKLWPSAPVGIYSAGLGRKETRAQVTFCGIQSVVKKPASFGHIDFVVIDEAHRMSPNASTSYGKFISALREKNPNLIVIGFTATPFRMKGGLLTEMELFDDIVFDLGSGQSFVWAIENGYLSKPVPKHPGFQLDETELHLRGGEYIDSEASDAFRDQDILERAVNEMVQIGSEQNRQAWLTFCQSIDDAEMVADMFRYKGYPVEAVHSKRSDRDDVLAKFKRGELRGVTNKDILCLSDDTEILTRQGWVGMDYMTYDHDVACWDTDGSVRFAPPKHITRRPLLPGEHMIETTGRGLNFKVTGNHRMVTKGTTGAITVMSADELYARKTQTKIPLSGLSKPDDVSPALSRKTSDCKYRASRKYVHLQQGLSETAAVEAAEADLHQRRAQVSPIPSALTLDECKLIGFWLGDGTLHKRSRSQGYGWECSLSQSKVYPDNVAEIDRILDACKMPHSRHEVYNGTIRWSLNAGWSIKFPHNGWRRLLPYLVKDGSDLLWGMSREQLLSLLTGFSLADGLHTGAYADSGVITNTNKSLLDLLQAICVCRGLTASVAQMSPSPKATKPIYRFIFREKEVSSVVPSHAPLEKVPYDPDGKVWCVTSETSYLIVRRKGKAMVIGNTTGFDHPPIDMIGMLRLTRSPGLWVQMLGRGTRPVFAPGYDITTLEGRQHAILASHKQNCVVLDFCGNTDRLGPINYPVIPKRRKKGTGGGTAPSRLCPQCSTYNHAAATVCDECGYEFPPPERFNPEASIKDLVADGIVDLTKQPEPRKEEVFGVNRMICSHHNGRNGKLDTMRVDYFTGVTRHSAWVCFNHPDGTFPRRRAEDWWKGHGGQGDAPTDVSVAVEAAGNLSMPKFIKVWTNTKYPEILAYDYIGTRFQLPPELGGPPLQEPEPDIVTERLEAKDAANQRMVEQMIEEMGGDIPF